MAKIVGQPKKDFDTDKDGLSDWEEVNIYGSNPYNKDSNFDGINDGETVRRGFHPVTGESLKDFFIPHEGNDYQPKFLQPKRILFHMGVAFLVKLLVVAFVLSYPLSVWMSPDMISQQQKEIISSTNDLRQGLEIDKLIENELLNRSAYEKVQDMFINQYFAHTSPQLKGLKNFLNNAGYNYRVAGENLAIGFDTADLVMTAWIKSPMHYANLIDDDFEEMGVAVVEGIFENRNTILIAQHFGAKNEKFNLKSDKDEIDLVSLVKEKKEEELILDLDTEDASRFKKTEVFIDQPSRRGEVFVMINAELEEDVSRATANVLGNQIELIQNSQGNWQASEIVYSKKESFVVPATLTTIDNKNKTIHEELSVGQIKLQKTSLIDQYLMLKRNPDKVLNKFFDFGSSYFMIILFFVCLAMICNVFIEIKKQYPKLIFSGLSLVIVLVGLIFV